MAQTGGQRVRVPGLGVVAIVAAIAATTLFITSPGAPHADVSARGLAHTALRAGRAPVVAPRLAAADVEAQHARAAIEGTVVDARVIPVAGATVVLTHTPGLRGPGTPATQVLFQRRTGRDGRFAFAGLSPGVYALSAMAYQQVPGVAGPFVLAAGQTKTQRLRTGPGGIALAGRVHTADGAVVPGAVVRAVEALAAGGPGPARIFQASADATGTYRLQLAHAHYRIWAGAPGHARAHDAIALVQGTTRDLRLPPAARIVGRVIDQQRRPVPGAQLWLSSIGARGGEQPQALRSGDQGDFAFTDLDPGDYRIAARKEPLAGTSALLSVTRGQATTGVSIELEPGFVVAGRVANPLGKPLARARVWLAQRQPALEPPRFVRSEFDGRFRFEGILPGRFHLEVTADGLAGVGQDLQLSGDMPSLALRLIREAALTGRVLTAQGHPAAGASVVLHRRGARPDAALIQQAICGDEGAFDLRGLPAGQLSLTVQHPTLGPARSQDVTLREGEQQALTVRLPAPQPIAGTKDAVARRPVATTSKRAAGAQLVRVAASARPLNRIAARSGARSWPRATPATPRPRLPQ